MIVLQIYFTVEAAAADKFEQIYATSYCAALRKQYGYQASRLLRVFDAAVSSEIAATPSSFNYQMELQFSSEEARRDWVKSPEHNEVWSLASALSTVTQWRGYDLVANDSL